MARYIDVEELTQEVERIIESNTKNLDISPHTKEAYLLGMKHTLDFVKVTPGADVVEVVRCKDCKYAKINENHPMKPLVCFMTKMVGSTKPNWYCADGERNREVKWSKQGECPIQMTEEQSNAIYNDDTGE